MNFMIRRFVLPFAVVALLAGASSAYADTINYQITGPGSSGTFTASFTLSGNLTPSGGNSLVFWFTSVPVDVNGSWKNVTLTFSSLLGGGVLSTNSFTLVGQQLFSWSSSSTLIMNSGTFNLWGWTGNGWGYYTVTVTRSVPEPTSLILLGTGIFILFGAHLLRRLRHIRQA